MERIYHPYDQWEDYKKGMYEVKNASNELENKAVSLLKNIPKLGIVANKVLEKWPIATLENLTNDNCNKIAWLGQASCCYEYGVPEVSTKKAWVRLDEFEQFRSNKIVKQAIDNWLEKHNNLDKKQMSLYE